MGFFDDLGKKVTDAGQKTLKKTKDMSETVKLNSMVSDEEKKITNAYIQIGQLFVSTYGTNCDDNFKELVSKIYESQNKIEQYRKQIQDIKGVQRCEKCGAEIPLGVAFCSICGAEVPKVQPVMQQNTVCCTNCGTVIPEGMSFCTQCGTPVSKTEPTAEAPISEAQPEASEVQSQESSSQTESVVSTEENAEKVCPNCGAKVASDLAFCIECGTKLTE